MSEPLTKEDLKQALGSVVKELLQHTDARLDATMAQITTRFEAVDIRLHTLDRRLEAVDTRLDTLDRRLEAVDTRLDTLDHRLEAVDGRLTGLEARLTGLEARLTEHIYDTETKLLRAFSDYNNNIVIRMRKLEADMGNLDVSNTVRLAKLEEQITDFGIRIIRLEDRPSRGQA